MGVAMAWVTYTGAPPSTWADTREPKQSKNVTQAHPSMPFIPKYSIVPDTHAQNQMKGNKSNGTNPQKELSPNSIDSTRVQLCSTKRCASILLDVFQLWFVSARILPPIQKNGENWIGRTGRFYKGNVQSKCVWWCSSLPGAHVSQWTGSCSGWVNEVSPQEDISVHLWVPTLAGQCGN